MKNNTLIKIITLIYMGFILFSCQKDEFIEPKPSIIEYDFIVPGKLGFNFKQQIKDDNTILSKDSVAIKNNNINSISTNFVIYAFKESAKNFNNISFIHQQSIELLAINTKTDYTLLNSVNYLFNDENILVSVLNINEEKHEFSGYYHGEINIIDTNNNFVKSLVTSGVIDYQGNFNLFVETLEEIELVYLKGRINFDNLNVTGKIYNKENTTSVEIGNVDNETLSLDAENNLTGNLSYEDSNEDMITISFNLNKQN